MPISQQKFGIEIECFNVTDAILRHVAATWAGWSSHGDGSIHGRNQPGRYASEIVSPPLPATDASFRQVKEVMRYLRSEGVRINKSCGQHVHVDLSADIDSGAVVPGLVFQNLFERYQALESQLDWLVPPSRRGNLNSYCHSTNVVSPYDQSGLNRVYMLDRFPIEDREYDTIIAVSRGYKLNVSAYERHGTVEIRHGGATLNGTKAVSWIRLCLAFVKYAKLLSLRDTTERRERIESEYNDMFAMLNSTRHVTYLQARIAEAQNPTPRVATPAVTTDVVEAASEGYDQDAGPSFAPEVEWRDDEEPEDYDYNPNEYPTDYGHNY